jgi:putative peptide zinc metalloprotease protein
MPTLADSLVSSSARALTLRKRPDLTAKQHRYQGRVYWVIKDPVGLRYFRFQEEEFAILNMLDGQTSLDEIKERFEEEFPPQKITVEELGQFIGMLHRSGLIIADAAGQGVQLKRRRDQRKRQELLAALGNILAIRFKGIDPDKLLTWMLPYMNWFFTRQAMIGCIVLWLSALTLVTVQFDTFQSKLPSFHQFFTAENWIYFTVALCVTKIIHEFGHGLSCKYFGGECHEMGVMVLVLTPCLYCNVSDSWMLPNKWHRAAIGAGGMYIELCIASVCTWLWWFSLSGTLLNQLCLSTMFVCSVSTLMFNANPLLRYDGYYILSDLTEIPNLRQKASSILSRKLGKWCLGLEEQDDPFLPERHQIFFALYSVAAAIYRWVVMFSILWFLYKVFEPYGLKVISQTIASVAIISLIVQPLWKLGKFFYVPGRLDQVKRKNVYWTLAVLSAVAAFIFTVPLPYRVKCSLEVRPRDAESVYVSVPGEIDSVEVKSGDAVVKGQPIAKLSNVDLELKIAELEGRRDEYEARLNGLRREIFDDSSASEQIPGVKESLDAVNKQLDEKRQDLARLNLLAPVSGTVLPPPDLPSKPEAPGQLPTWSGSPLQARNRGAFLTESTLFCQIGNPKELEANLIIDQEEMPFVHEGDILDIKLDELPYATAIRTKITETAQSDLQAVSRGLTNKSGGDVITETDESGIERPMNTSYAARAPIEDTEGVMYLGLRGKAKIYTRWQTIAERGWRYLTRTFNFQL